MYSNLNILLTPLHFIQCLTLEIKTGKSWICGPGLITINPSLWKFYVFDS